ncbi:1,5-anhydro-D-fructose reductase [Paenibacillus konkukensis]|uniref:1,5-anhydro-D-fructose reductase n=1 Tax=Paenibacillus konkukensis TaxID=2020716 RepID=A0ABY4RL12_9BACL|nr:Gfo/Idh/MocA family oxidoreductase [Paenibacillus konkukensis]UQZ82556.1 1,5-anhydro-D-fructose reductase [Paenibacillus konkukensis]
MTSNGIGYAVFGLGVGKSHLASAVKAEGCAFVAICDMNEAVLNKLGDEYGIDPANRYTSYEELLKRDDIKAVSICTPSGWHRDHTVQALRAGKHVLTEKPLEIRLDRIDEMNRTAEEEGLYLGCVFQNRLAPANRFIKDTLDSGRMGKPITCNFHLKWYRDDNYYAKNGGWRGTWEMDGGGAIMNQTIHTVDLMQWFMGPVRSIFAKAGTYNHPIETEDTAVAVVTFESGAIGTLIGTTCAYPGLEVSAQIHGSRGSIYAKNNRIELFKMADDDEQFSEEARIIAAYGSGAKSAPSSPQAGGGQPKTGHAGQVQDMIEAVIHHRPPMIEGREGRASVEIVQALYESARTGQEVFLPYTPEGSGR